MAGLCYLVHAGLVQSHDGGVSQPVVHSAQGFLGIEILGFEQLLHEIFLEHGRDDVVHNCKDKEALWFAPEQHVPGLPQLHGSHQGYLCRAGTEHNRRGGTAPPDPTRPQSHLG